MQILSGDGDSPDEQTLEDYVGIQYNQMTSHPQVSELTCEIKAAYLHAS